MMVGKGRLAGILVSTALFFGSVAWGSAPFKANSFSFTIPTTVPYTLDITSLLTNPSETGLSFGVSSGQPSWLTLSATTETLTGTPPASAAGQVTFTLSASTGEQGGSTQITLTLVDQPAWTQNPINLGNLNENAPFNLNLTTDVTVPGDNALTFSVAAGSQLPDWLTLTPAGVLSGTPGLKDVGTFQNIGIVVTSASGGTATTELEGAVVLVPAAPIINTNALNFTINERTTQTIDLTQFVTDPNGLSDTYTITPSATWASLTAGGQLTLSPTQPQVGVNKFTLTVANSELSSSATVTVTVVRVPQYPVWAQNPINLQAQIRLPFSASVGSLCTDPDGVAVTFSLVSGPTWLTVGADGSLSGTPQATNLGTNSFVVSCKNDALASSASLVVTVFDPYHPVWSQNPITLPSAPERSPYSQSIASYASDTSPTETLTFSKISGPAWASISSTGVITGTPQRADDGQGTFVVQATDTAGQSATTNVLITVTYVARPPQWNTNPISLPNAYDNAPYTYSIAQFAIDPDGNPITFELISGPTWMHVAANGAITGSPARADDGPYSAVFAVTDGTTAVQADATGTVIHVPQPPVINTTALTFTMNERTTQTIDLSQFVTDPEGDPVSFAFSNPASWETLTTTGSLTLTPTQPQVGTNAFSLTVTDSTIPTLQATATVTILVNRVPQAPVWSENPINMTATQGQAFSSSIAPFARDLDGVALTFSLTSGPSWLTVNSNGTISGTPTTIGANTFVVTAKNDALSTNDALVINVVSPYAPPQWTTNPITLPDATATQAYTQTIASFVKVAQGDTVTFSKVSGPAWANLSASGVISGTPAMSDVGQGTFVVQAADPGGQTASVTVLITVDKPILPPSWTQNPILLPNATQDTTYSFTLAPYAVDTSGLTLTFSKVSGPAWMFVGSDGTITGTPAAADVGNFTAVFAVTDGHTTVTTNGIGQVLPKLHPPVIVNGELVFIINEGTTTTFNLNQAQYVVNQDNVPLTFTLQNGDPWITLSAAGSLVMSPKYNAIGDHNYGLTVTDSRGLSDIGGIFVRVVPNPQPPVWSQNPIPFNAEATVPFTASVASYASDPDGSPLTFSLVNGPAWLSVSSSGALSGTPQNTDSGANTFVVATSNGTFSTNVNVIITVKVPVPQTDTTVIDAAVAGAAADNLWVVENTCESCGGDPLANALKQDIHYYFDALNTAEVHDVGVFLSSDAAQWDGKPVPAKNGSWLLSWNESNEASDFAYRVDSTIVDSCENSPIWSLFRFQQQVTSFTQIYQKGYFNPGVPMDIMIVTDEDDQYQSYDYNTPQRSYGASDFANAFIKFYQTHKKPLRISAIAPQCRSHNLRHPITDDANAYQTLVTATGGKYYPDTCDLNFEQALQDYAKAVQFRAVVAAKQVIKLSQTPVDSTKITVTLGGTLLPGNTGASTDVWTYDTTSNAIHIDWSKIDFTKLTAGEQIQISYTTFGSSLASRLAPLAKLLSIKGS